jgi:hypothetical protein
MAKNDECHPKDNCTQRFKENISQLLNLFLGLMAQSYLYSVNIPHGIGMIRNSRLLDTLYPWGAIGMQGQAALTTGHIPRHDTYYPFIHIGS